MDLIVVRIKKNGKLAESAPCYHCTRQLSYNKIIFIDNLYYSRDDETITCIKFKDWLCQGTSHISRCWKHLNKK
jgi:hypothetical protein